ncbi:MAG: hypothetical protein M1820_000967 [Bogoriella megaspora]|nr:MAG: hypothetical protein M1820_000967 [Bogoriella megaspora]
MYLLQEDQEAHGKCSFLQTPLEVRLQIYDYILAPLGYIKQSLDDERYPDRDDDYSEARFAKRLPSRLTPVPELELCTTCRQIYEESRDIVFRKNTFMLSSKICLGQFDYERGDERFNRHTLARMQHVFLTIDSVHFGTDLDWRYFQAMTSLRTMTICALHCRSVCKGRQLRRWEWNIKWLIRSIPATCSLQFGASSDLEVAYLKERSQWIYSISKPVCRESLKAASDPSLHELGRFNGYTTDFRHVSQKPPVVKLTWPAFKLGPQTHGILSLPVRIRHQIWKYVAAEGTLPVDAD